MNRKIAIYLFLAITLVAVGFFSGKIIYDKNSKCYAVIDTIKDGGVDYFLSETIHKWSQDSGLSANEIRGNYCPNVNVEKNTVCIALVPIDQNAKVYPRYCFEKSSGNYSQATYEH